ncbi:hypothetical protein [Pontibacter pudoricolor]|uniref:hypothetical protein n=1 Tax=Pontibacter pudoricolor TaxID=2694930 RepID=UPI001391A35F|nr:hypothetical protein [Pontibacter pudoricolor]
MNKLNYLLIWCLCLGTLISCGDKDEAAQPASEAAADYIPSTKGSTWNYGGKTPYTCIATGETKVIDGKTYTKIEARAGSQVNVSYLHKENGVYTQVAFQPNIPQEPIPMLKEHLPVGGTWEVAMVVNGINTKMAFAIKAKGMAKTVEGNSYKEVIHVEMVSSYTYMGYEVMEPITTNYYYAKGVGLIFSEFVGMESRPLLSYDIK